jgi:hypothetical protein
LDVVVAIAPNEGFLDAIRMQDAGILSTGIHQWSAHADLELPSLLHCFKQTNPDEFMLYFGLYNLDVRRDGQNSFMLQSVQPNGSVTDLPVRQRRAFFGGTTSGNLTTFRTDWAARVREASVASINYRAAQIREAVARFDRIQREVGNITVQLRGGRIQVPVNQLITSQFGAALVLDSHINLPGLVRPDLQRVANDVGTQPDEDALEQAIVNRYEAIRRTFDTPGRNARIHRRLDHRPGSHGHGSFAGW